MADSVVERLTSRADTNTAVAGRASCTLNASAEVVWSANSVVEGLTGGTDAVAAAAG